MNSLFGNLFDWNGDGKLDTLERTLEYSALNNLLQEDEEENEWDDLDDIDEEDE